MLASQRLHENKMPAFRPFIDYPPSTDNNIPVWEPFYPNNSVSFQTLWE